MISYWTGFADVNLSESKHLSGIVRSYGTWSVVTSRQSFINQKFQVRTPELTRQKHKQIQSRNGWCRPQITQFDVVIFSRSECNDKLETCRFVQWEVESLDTEKYVGCWSRDIRSCVWLNDVGSHSDGEIAESERLMINFDIQWIKICFVINKNFDLKLFEYDGILCTYFNSKIIWIHNPETQSCLKRAIKWCFSGLMLYISKGIYKYSVCYRKWNRSWINKWC